ncbi:MAG: inner membrane CreD family protein [Verrucomicrobiales bacterium]
MTIARLLAIAGILAATTAAWAVLGAAIKVRTNEGGACIAPEVAALWGPPQEQREPTAWYAAPQGGGKRAILPASSDIAVDLRFEPKRRGLIRYRTYAVDFEGNYAFENPTPIAQTIYFQIQLPPGSSYSEFALEVNGQRSDKELAAGGAITESATLAPGARAEVRFSYVSRGLEEWRYAFGEANRTRNFALAMRTDFADIDFPAGTSSGTAERKANAAGGFDLRWEYPAELYPRPVGMAMPKVVNPGPTAQRMAFFAPVSLLFYFAVVTLLGIAKRAPLHPMNYFFLAASFFAFHLLFAYLVDHLDLHLSFAIAALVSVALAFGYLRAVADRRLLRAALAAQLAYQILFSYTFFFDGFTGLAITVGAIVTLATLMVATAKVDWSKALRANSAAVPPPAPPVGDGGSGAIA